jgi:hypothetical protein
MPHKALLCKNILHSRIAKSIEHSMKRTYLAAVLLLTSTLAFATGTCGEDPTKPTVPPRCNGIVHQPFNFRVLPCYGKTFCADYNRAAEILMLTPMHGRHGHGQNGDGWTANMQWTVPADLKNVRLVIAVDSKLRLFLNGREITENFPGEYTIEFGEGYLVLTPKQDGTLALPEYGIL